MTVEEILKLHGRTFTNQRLPSAFRYRRRKACFLNAYKLMYQSDGRRLHYCEGMCRFNDDSLPTLHAFCVDGDGNVIDVTWKYHSSHRYHGVVLNDHFVAKATNALGCHDSRLEYAARRLSSKEIEKMIDPLDC